jgi:5'-3' exonuclease
MIVHLVDGTYELFRHFYGIRRFKKTDPPFGAVSGVLATVAQLIDEGGTHVGALLAQFVPLEEALLAMGVVVWPMIDLEADDALASAAYLAEQDERVEKVCIWTPDKDLAQCVRDDRVVQVDRRSGVIRNAEGVQAKFGVHPEFIPDYLAMVGDSADGYPGIAGFGPKTAAQFINRYGPIEDFPPDALNEENRMHALLFKDLATLRIDAPLFDDVEELRWRGPTVDFAPYAEKIENPRLLQRVRKLEKRLGATD